MIKKDEFINIANEDYLVLDVLKEDDKEYAIANKILNGDESSNEYRIIFEDNNQIIFLENIELINKLLPKFENNLLLEAQQMDMEE